MPGTAQTRPGRMVGALGLMVGLSGCGYALMQSARPTPAGELDVTVGAGVVYNQMVDDRGMATDNVPPQIALRYGVRDDLDLGIKMFMGAGGLVDGKWNLRSPTDPVAISVQLGLGAAGVPANVFGQTGAVLHLPVRVLASWDLPVATPYAGIGYGAFWVFGYGNRDPNTRYAARTGHGDGVLMLNAGVELFTHSSVQLLVEYSFWTQVVDDPGDFHSFDDNHMLHAGVTF